MVGGSKLTGGTTTVLGHSLSSSRFLLVTLSTTLIPTNIHTYTITNPNSIHTPPTIIHLIPQITNLNSIYNYSLKRTKLKQIDLDER